MVRRREIHIRATATGEWLVELDQADRPLPGHTSETAAERAALVAAAAYGVEPAIVVHDRYGRLHAGPLCGYARE